MSDRDPSRLLGESLRDLAIIVLDVEGRIETWSPGAEQLFGFAAAEIIGQPLDLFFPEEDRRLARPRRLLGQAVARGHVEDEGWRVRKDGSRFWADVVIQAVRDAAGALVGFAHLARDFTDRRLIEDALRASEERFRLMVDAVKDYAIFMLDPTGRVATWNSGARRIKGYDAAEIIGQPFTRFYTALDIARGTPKRGLATATSEGRFEDEGWRVRKDGSTFWASVILNAVRTPSGGLLGFVKVTRDLTELRRAEDERLLLARAEEAVRLRDDFLLVAAHELRTPLTALQLQLQSLNLNAKGLDPKHVARLARALRSSNRVVALIESLLDVSRIAIGRFELVRAEHDLAAIAGEHVDGLRGLADRAASDLTLVFPGPIVGRWDAVRLGQVIDNLVSNALKFGAGRPVQVSLSVDGADAVLEVRDHGPGIAGDDATRIFERFERSAPLRHYGGFGLGLYVSRAIVEAHGGTIVARNHPDGGALFTVRLPRQLEA